MLGFTDSVPEACFETRSEICYKPRLQTRSETRSTIHLSLRLVQQFGKIGHGTDPRIADFGVLLESIKRTNPQ